MAKSNRFDEHLIPKVVKDANFRLLGYVTGSYGKWMYAVINPARRTVNVWTKQNDKKFDSGDYMKTANDHDTIVCTNGPPMESRMGSGTAAMFQGFADSMLNDTPWDSYDVVISGGKVISRGRGYHKYFFQRQGSASFASYQIGKGQPSKAANEALGGLYGLVDKGVVVNNVDHKNLKKKKGAAVWCLRPRRKEDPAGFNGAIIVVAVRGYMTDLASRIVKVGCSHAVAMDGSDSVVAGFAKKMKIKCDGKKDRIQRWGLYCKAVGE